MLTLRLDKKTEKKLEQRSQALGISKSEFVRKSIHHYLTVEEQSTPYELGKDLFGKYSDQPIDFADGCLLFLAERLGILDIATVDSDFEIYRLSNNRTFRIHVKS